MSDRRPLIAGNWKMFNSVAAGVVLTGDVDRLLDEGVTSDVEVVVAPSFTGLYAVSRLIELDALRIGLSAQSCHWEDEGAFTGEVSPMQLSDIGCTYVILGHSERRQLFGETDETVNRKVKAVLQHGMRPIVCVGESLGTREAGETEDYVRMQVRGGLDGLTTEQAAEIVVAYEPIWAIGTGRAAVPEDANDVARSIRATIGAMFGPPIAMGTRILYGGSVKPENARMFLSEPDIDGALVGGAALDAKSFAAICEAAR